MTKKNHPIELQKNFLNIQAKALRAFVITLNLLSFACLPDFVNAAETPQERDLYNTLPGRSEEGSILDVTNPIDLMNRLRRATAMDNATSPSDAIDNALKLLDQKEEREQDITFD